MSRLAQISYSVFLVHFRSQPAGQCGGQLFLPANPVINGLGMLLAPGAEHRGRRRVPPPHRAPGLAIRTRLLFPAGVVAGGWLAALAATNLGG